MIVLQVSALQTFFKINLQLGMDLSPVLAVPSPFFRDIHRCQIQHFQQAVVRWKYRLGFRHFPQLPVKSFYGICRVNQPSYRFRILEIGGKGCPVVVP